MALISKLEKISLKNKAITDIADLDFEGKKYYRMIAFYSWEDERIVAQVVKIKDL